MTDEANDGRAPLSHRRGDGFEARLRGRAVGGAPPAALGSRRGTVRPDRAVQFRRDISVPAARRSSDRRRAPPRHAAAARRDRPASARCATSVRATSFVVSPPSSALQKTKASAPTSSTTSTCAGMPSGATSSDSGRTPSTRLVRPLAATPCESGTSTPPNDAVPLFDLHRAEVHRGRADEAGHEHVRRPLVELARWPALLQVPVVQDGDAVAERHRLGLVVRHVDGRDPEVGLQRRDVCAHLHAELRIEVRQRLVHQEDARHAHDRPPHGHALALPARELAGLRSRNSVSPSSFATSLHALLAFGLPHPRDARAGSRCSRRRSDTGRARSSGTPSRRRAPSAARR